MEEVGDPIAADAVVVVVAEEEEEEEAVVDIAVPKRTWRPSSR